MEEDLDKMEAFKLYYKNKAGCKTSWPVYLTQFEVSFLLEDLTNTLFSMKELKERISKLCNMASGNNSQYRQQNI